MILIQCIRDLEHRFDEASGWCANCGKVRGDGRRIGDIRDRTLDVPDITEPRRGGNR